MFGQMVMYIKFSKRNISISAVLHFNLYVHITLLKSIEAIDEQLL